MSVRFTTARTTSYIAYLRPIITGRMSRVSRFQSRVFRSRGTYHGRNHNNEWPQFSRYKPRDGTAFFLAFRIKPVKRNAEARIFNSISGGWQPVVTKMRDALLCIANNLRKINHVCLLKRNIIFNIYEELIKKNILYNFSSERITCYINVTFYNYITSNINGI